MLGLGLSGEFAFAVDVLLAKADPEVVLTKSNEPLAVELRDADDEFDRTKVLEGPWSWG